MPRGLILGYGGSQVAGHPLVCRSLGAKHMLNLKGAWGLREP